LVVRLRASFLRRAVERYYMTEGAKPYFPKVGIHCGNCLIDGEVKFNVWQMAVELKSDKDDILRGLGQLIEALAHGYDMALLVTSQKSRKTRPKGFPSHRHRAGNGEQQRRTKNYSGAENNKTYRGKLNHEFGEQLPEVSNTRIQTL